MKTLFFEGAGYVSRGDVENCRIRTAFYNTEGRAIYLELTGIERNQYTAKSLACYDNIGFVDFCHYITEDLDDCNNSRIHEWPDGQILERRIHFEYCKKEILNFVNKTLLGDFDEIKICDCFDGYRVHRNLEHDNRGEEKPIRTGFDKYNFMEDFPYVKEYAEARRETFKKYDEEYKTKTKNKYSVLNVERIRNDSMTIYSYASEKELRDAELPRTLTLYLKKKDDGTFEYSPKPKLKVKENAPIQR